MDMNLFNESDLSGAMRKHMSNLAICSYLSILMDCFFVSQTSQLISG